MMIGITTSCDPIRLQKVMGLAMRAFNQYAGWTKQDKEEMLLGVVQLFEETEGKFPNCVYVRRAHHIIQGEHTFYHAQKRKYSKMVDGKRVFYDDYSLDMPYGEEEDMTLSDFIPSKSTSLREVELLADIALIDPELVPLVRRVLRGEKLDRKEKRLLRKKLRKEDLL